MLCSYIRLLQIDSPMLCIDLVFGSVLIEVAILRRRIVPYLDELEREAFKEWVSNYVISLVVLSA